MEKKLVSLKKEIFVGFRDYMTIKELVDNLLEIEKKCGDTATIEYNEWDNDLTVRPRRLETDEEFEARVKKEKERALESEIRRKERIEKLKAELKELNEEE